MVAATLLAATLGGCSEADGEPVSITPSSVTASEPATTGSDATAEDGDASAGPEPSSSQVSQDGVVDGFPSDVLPVPDGAQVLLTSAVPSGDTLAVSLSGRTAQPAESVLETYRGSLGAAGFAESPSAGAPGAVAATFTRGGGAEVVTLAVVPPTADGGESTFTVGGTVLAPAP